MSKSGRHCSVHGCSYNWKKLKMMLDQSCFEHFPTKRSSCPCEAPFAFFKMPMCPELKRLWLAALKRKNPPKTIFVCSFHFVDKKPTEQNPVPQLYLGYEKEVKQRRLLVRRDVSSSSSQIVSGKGKASHSNVPPLPENQLKDATCPSSEDRLRIEDCNVSDNIVTSTECNVSDNIVTSNETSKVDSSTQWIDPSLEAHNYAKTVTKQRTVGPQTIFPSMIIIALTTIKSNSDAFVYTGVRCEIFWELVKVLSPYAQKSFRMPVADQILMTLMKLKLNLIHSDLAKRFSVSQSLVSKINAFWIDVMAEHLNEFVAWMPRETIRATMPSCFKTRYPKTTCIIDCAETFMQKPKNLKSRGETYSRYKSHNTVKYLVAIAPCGLIMFISHAYGGRASDRFIVEHSGLINLLVPGDEVMADRGFTISDLLFPRQVKLNIPAFTGGKQLSEDDVTSTRRLANVRIHVERVIRRLKVFKILKETVPITLTSKIDQILKICAALVNIRDDLIREDDEDD